MSILSELSVKKLAEVCREHGIHPAIVCKWKREFNQSPDKAFSGKGNTWKAESEVAKYERLVGQLYAENLFLKKNIRSLLESQAEKEKRRHIK